MTPETLGRELGVISTNIRILIEKTSALSEKIENMSLINNTHCLKIGDIEKTCENRLKAIKWFLALTISVIGTYIAYVKI